MVVDQLAQLGRDRLSDLSDTGESAQARPELLDRLQLGGPRRHPVEVLRSADRHPGLGRKRPDRIELVVRPVMGLVVVDVEHPEHLGAVEERRRTERVEAFLDDGGANALAAWVVRVPDGEERPTSDHRKRGERPLREVADAVEEGGRESATHLGDGLTVRAPEEDAGAIAFEQDHRVVDQAGQDPVEVEAAPDVRGDAPERLGTMEEVGDLVGTLRTAHDRPKTFGDDSGDVEIPGAEGTTGLPDDQEDAPWRGRTRDRDGQLGSIVGQDRDDLPIPIAFEQDPRHRRAAASFHPRGELEGPAEDPVPTGQIDEPDRPSDVGGSDGAWREAFAVRFPGGHEVMPIGVAERTDGRSERLVRILIRVDEPGDRRRDGQVELISLCIERVGRERLGSSAGGRGEPGGRRRIDPPPAPALPGRDGWIALGGRGLRRREEALEITEAIAPVSARVDPVIPEPAGVAPGADRVRVDTKQPGGLGDRQGRIRWARRGGDRHGS